jgi:N-carbamoyl-L-amino-acid hydrolase
MMASGASHDAAHVAKIAPAGMLFVPCRSGMSHVPDESAEPADIASGASVLAAAVQALQYETPAQAYGAGLSSS